MQELDQVMQSLKKLFTEENPDREEFDRAVEALAFRLGNEGKTKGEELLRWLKKELDPQPQGEQVRSWEEIMVDLRRRLETDTQRGRESLSELAAGFAALSAEYTQRGKSFAAQQLETASTSLNKMANTTSEFLQPLLSKAKSVVLSGFEKLKTAVRGQHLSPDQHPQAPPPEDVNACEPPTAATPTVSPAPVEPLRPTDSADNTPAPSNPVDGNEPPPVNPS
jgi:ABC-type transporter Mla subunit MlaD